MSFKEKVVIITGSSSGIGAAAAHHFAKQSAKVVIVGRNEERLKNVAKSVEEIKGFKPLVVKADLTKDDEVKKVIDETIKTFGKIDVLVNNAGAGAVASLKDGIQPFDNMISTNLRSTYLMTHLAAPYLIKTKGNVINVSSVRSVKGSSVSLPYCVAKAGLDMFTKCIAKDLATHGVRVNSVNPGPVKTNFVSALGFKGEQADQFLKTVSDSCALGFIATSEDVADIIIFLASDKARSITGSIYFIDNGFLLS